jgi:hypothetical protein
MMIVFEQSIIDGGILGFLLLKNYKQACLRTTLLTTIAPY